MTASRSVGESSGIRERPLHETWQPYDPALP